MSSHKKRKLGSYPTSSGPMVEMEHKSWKGRLLVTNNTVKKSERAQKRVVHFSRATSQFPNFVVELQKNKVRSSWPIKARQCLKFELHYTLHGQQPPDTRLFVFVALYKSDSMEEVKEGVVNNFAYLTCAGHSGVAVFQKLYLETRSKDRHYLDFSLWLGCSDSQYASLPRDCAYPVCGANNYRTEPFTPKSSARRIPTTVPNSGKTGLKLTKIVPDKGAQGDTVYLTFAWPGHEKDLSGEIFVVWNESILHLPFFDKGKTEKIVVVEHAPPPPPNKAVIPIFLKEKPEQQSARIGAESNSLHFEYVQMGERMHHSPLDHQRMNTERYYSDTSLSDYSSGTDVLGSQSGRDSMTISSVSGGETGMREFSIEGEPSFQHNGVPPHPHFNTSPHVPSYHDGTPFNGPSVWGQPEQHNFAFGYHPQR